MFLKKEINNGSLQMQSMLKVAAYLGYQVLILGAFGCGAFGNDAHVVSDLFYKALKEFNFSGWEAKHFFYQIDFAVMDHSAEQYNFKEFARNFNDFYRDGENEKQTYAFFWLDNEKYGEFSNWFVRPLSSMISSIFA